MRSKTVARPRERSYRRSSSPSRAGPDGDSSDPPDAEPERLCENPDCTRGPGGGRADISHLGPDARYCDNEGACRQAAYRDRLTHAAAERRFGEVAWGVACKYPDTHGQFAPEGVCFACGHPRVAPTVGWETDGPKENRSYVSAPTPKRKTRRLGDGSPKLVFADEHGERRRLTDEGVVAA
jgi:hypothetical protein